MAEERVRYSDDGDTADGQATFKCYNKKPTIDMTVGLKGV